MRSVFRKRKYIVGVDWGEGPPVPIPNTEVKLTFADNTLRVTARDRAQQGEPNGNAVTDVAALLLKKIGPLAQLVRASGS